VYVVGNELIISYIVSL